MGCLSFLVPLDAEVYAWVKRHRSAWLDQIYHVLRNGPLLSLLLLWGLVLLWNGIHQRWAEAWHLAAIVILNAFLIELLKTALERARPSAVSSFLVGNSFPSGHAASALLVGGILGYELFRQRVAPWIKGAGTVALLLLVGLVLWQRLYLSRHWLSDIAGSAFLAGAWLCYTLPRPALLQPSLRNVLVWIGCGVCYQVFYFFPESRIFLPSVLSLPKVP